MRRPRAPIFLCILATFGVASCKAARPPAPPPTAVAQGERFETGHPVYDEYFATVHELHAAVATGGLEERDARTTLATMLELLPTAPAEQILRKLRARESDLPRVELVVSDDPASKRQTAKVKLLQGRMDEASKSLLMVVEASALASLDLVRRMGEIPERSRRMHSLCKTLTEGADKEFAGEPAERRRQIRLELEASQDVLVLVANEARAVKQRARQFVTGMQEALVATEDNEPTEASQAPSAPARKPEPKMPSDFNP